LTDDTDQENTDDNIMEDDSGKICKKKNRCLITFTITAETASYPQTNSETSTPLLNEYPLATQTNDESDTQSDRILFSHDVHPNQKDHYLTNQYRIDGESVGRGGISLIQGIKTQEKLKKKTQVLPFIRVSALVKSPTTDKNRRYFLLIVLIIFLNVMVLS
jgi:hypothetical protein